MLRALNKIYFVHNIVQICPLVRSSERSLYCPKCHQCLGNWRTSQLFQLEERTKGHKGAKLNPSKYGGWFNYGIDFWLKINSFTARMWRSEESCVARYKKMPIIKFFVLKCEEFTGNTDIVSPHSVFWGTVPNSLH
jgi:hypothetical protein